MLGAREGRSSLLPRVLASIADGTFLVRAANHLSRVKYVPPESRAVDRCLAHHYPGDRWRTFSAEARELWIQLQPVMEGGGIDSVVFVGAHNGSTALAMDQAFPGLSFLLLEPAPETYRELVENTCHRPNMRCLSVAAGERGGTEQMLIDEFSPASSFLPYEQVAIREYPFLGNQTLVTVEMQPLDDLLRHLQQPRADMLVIDVQGYEDRVLRGAPRALETCRVVIVELSLQALYTGSSTFGSVHQTLVEGGFRLSHLMNPQTGESGRILQIDGVFTRKHRG